MSLFESFQGYAQSASNFGRAVVVDVIVSFDEKMLKGMLVQVSKNEEKSRTSEKGEEKESKTPGLTGPQADLAKQYIQKLLEFEKEADISKDDDKSKDSSEKEDPEKEKINSLIESIIGSRPCINSVIARLVPETSYDINRMILLQPMFPSHMQMPIKPGEQVFVLFPTTGDVNAKTKFGYWMCRIPGTNITEDTNYTHASRDFTSLPASEIRTSEKSGDNKIEEIPGFPNGNNVIDGRALCSPHDNPRTNNKKWQKEYTRIVKGSVSYSQFIPESVPRYIKRPGDFVLQGSNNTLICLGEDRDSGGTGIATINKTDENLKGGAGTIDIVAGRGTEDVEVTAPLEIQNTRKYFETDKVRENTGEGDIHFTYDKSRIYVSMNTRGDDNLFGSKDDEAKMPLPKIPLANKESNEGDVIEQTPPRPYIIQKSDEIRIVVRQGGSVKIVKEGVADDDKEGKGRAVIVIQPDGTIMIDGPKIVLGSGIEKAHGAGNQLAIGLDAKEPLVLGDSLGKILTTFLKACLDNKTSFSLGQSPNALHPVVIKAMMTALSDLGGSPYKPKNNTTLSKVGKTK